MQKIVCVLGLLLPVFCAYARTPFRSVSVSADFSFTNNACSGTPVQFTASVSSGTAPFTYTWDFGSGNTAAAQNSQYTFVSLGCATGSFPVALKVKDALGDSVIVRKNVSIKQSPNVTLQDLANTFSQFSNCSNSPTDASPLFTIRPGLGSPTDACISSFSVDWGDGSPVLSGLTVASFPLPAHTYNRLGIFNLAITAQGTNGCNTTKTYPVLNLANPAVGIEGPRGTTGCAPIGFWFKLKGYELNSPGTTYEWDFGDKSSNITWNTPITVDSIYHVFSTTSCGLPSNQFTVKVTARNGCDTKDATVNNIRIFQKPVANFNLPASGSGCVSTNVTFTSTSINAYNQGSCDRITNYTWSSDDGGTVSGTSYTHAFTTTGNHTVTLVAAGSCGNDTITKIISITAPPAAPVAGSNGPVCSGSVLNLTASTVAGATYAWTGPGGYTSSLQNPARTNATTAMSGTYSVTASLNGCTSAPSTVSVVVNATPSIPTTGNAAVPYCLNATAIPLTATGAAGNTLNWYTTATGGTPGTTAPTPITTVTGVTTYYVSQVNPATPACESGRLAITVTVRAAPVITGSSTDPTSCTVSNGSITLSGLSASTSHTVQYTRNSGTPFSGTLTSNASGILTITGLASGTYTNITAALSGCPSNAVGPFTLVSPSAPAAPAAGSNSPVCSGSVLNLTAGTVAGATYAWTGPGGYTSSLQNPARANATTAMSGAYSVAVTINGCTSAPATINVTIGQTAAAPIVTTPVDYCLNATASPLIATALAGYTLNWYTTATGGTASAATPTPSTAATGSVVYYVSQVASAAPACEGPRSPITVNVKPAPVIGGSATDPTGCASSNGMITITGLTAGTAYAVQYTRNGGAPVPVTLTASANGAVTITNLSAGTYANITAALNGCSSNALGPFTLTSFSAPATPTAGSNSPLCAGSALNLTASAAPAGAAYAWTGPRGYTSTLQNPVIANASTDMSGTYSVTVSLNGCISAPAAVNVVVNASGTVTAGSNSPLCAGGTLTLLSGINSTATFGWTWSGPNNFSSNQQNPSIQNATAAASGTYTVTASSPGGSCPSSASTTILITVQPAISAASAASPATCSAGTGSITLQGLAPNTTYAVQYSKNGSPQAAAALIANAGGSLLIPNLPGGVYSNITVSQGGCISNTVGPFTLTDTNTLPATPKANGNSPLCTGSTLQLGAGTTATGALAYQWNGPNGFTSTSQNPYISNVTLAAAGKYYVTVSAGSCVSAKDSVDIQVGSYPVVSLGPDLVLAPGSQHTFIPSIRNGPVSQYLWTPATNLSCTACISPVATAQASISYILKVTNSSGCSASDTISIKTLCEGSNVFIPDAFTPDGDGLNDKFMIRASGPVRVKYFRVFNKWGELVFDKMNFLPNDPAYGWDGRVRGMAVPPDVFVYTAMVTCEGGASFAYKGNVTVLK